MFTQAAMLLRKLAFLLLKVLCIELRLLPAFVRGEPIPFALSARFPALGGLIALASRNGQSSRAGLIHGGRAVVEVC